jgi:hypothetical protein
MYLGCVGYELRPLKATEILDRSFRIYREHWKLLVSINAALAAPAAALSLVLLEPIQRATPGHPPAMGAAFAAIFGGVALTVAAALPVQAAMTSAIRELYLGRPTSFGAAYAVARRRLGALFVATTLSTLAYLGGLAMCVLPGIVAAVGFAFVPQAVVLEGVGGRAALGRSWRLAKDLSASIFLVFFVFWTVAVVANLSVSNAVKAAGVPPLFGDIAGQLVAILVQPLTYIGLVITYFDARVRKEAFDLTIMAEGIAAGAPPSHAAA